MKSKKGEKSPIGYNLMVKRKGHSCSKITAPWLNFSQLGIGNTSSSNVESLAVTTQRAFKEVLNQGRK